VQTASIYNICALFESLFDFANLIFKIWKYVQNTFLEKDVVIKFFQL